MVITQEEINNGLRYASTEQLIEAFNTVFYEKILLIYELLDDRINGAHYE